MRAPLGPRCEREVVVAAWGSDPLGDGNPVTVAT